VAVKLEHVWVEGYVDFIPSRGAVHIQGDTWVPMDAAFKQYRHIPGMDVPTQVPFDVQHFLTQATQGATVNATEGWVQSLNQANINAILTAYQEQFQSFVASHKPDASVDDVLGTRQIIAAARPILAAGLPYTLVVRGRTLSTLPATLRHHVTVALFVSEVDQMLEAPAVQYAISLPALHTQRLVVTYAPATAAERQLIDSYKQQGATSLPAYLLRVTPRIQLDGVTVATGPADQMGRRHVWTVTLRDPQAQYTSTEQFTGSAGDEIVFSVNGNGLTDAVLRARFAQRPSDTAAENLYTISLCYWLLHDLADQMAARGYGVVAQRLPSVGLFAVPLQVRLVFGVPISGAYRARQGDVARALLAVAGATTDRVVAFRHQSGLQGGVLEGAVLDMVLDYPLGTSVSAVQVLREANAQGIPLYTLTAQTLPGALPQLQIDPDAVQDIITAVGTCKIVLVPARDIVHGEWTGVGYIIQDPVTGAGAYIIQGGLNGFFGVGPCRAEDSIEPIVQQIADIVFALSLFLLLLALILSMPQWMPVLAPALRGVVMLAWDVAVAVASPIPPTAEGLWNALFAPRYGPLLNYPDAKQYPGYDYTGTGTCLEDQIKFLRAGQFLWCDKPGSGACQTAARAKDCPLAAQCARNAELCIEARLTVMFVCFNGGDEQHWGQVKTRLKGLFNCVCEMDKRGCPPAFQLP
jgi:hypothetical protein